MIIRISIGRALWTIFAIQLTSELWKDKKKLKILCTLKNPIKSLVPTKITNSNLSHHISGWKMPSPAGTGKWNTAVKTCGEHQVSDLFVCSFHMKKGIFSFFWLFLEICLFRSLCVDKEIRQRKGSKASIKNRRFSWPTAKKAPLWRLWLARICQVLIFFLSNNFLTSFHTWHFYSFPLHEGSDVDAISRFTNAETRHLFCDKEAGKAMYIDAREIQQPQRSWDETGDVVSKVSPQ